MTRRVPTMVAVLALAVVYFLAGKFGLSLAFVNASASAVWPPTGISLAALLLFGYRLWPGIFVGAFLVNIATQGSVATSLGIAAGNTLEALAATWLVNRFSGGTKFFERVRTIFNFIALAALLSTVVSATFGVTSLCLGGFVGWEEYSTIWLTWWIGDASSNLIIAPLLIIWSRRPFFPLNPKQVLEIAAVFGIAALFGVAIFLEGIPFVARNQMKYLALVPLLWAAFRCGQRGAVTTAALISGLALWGATHDVGPFVTPDRNVTLLLLQAFIGTLTVTTLVLSAVVTERKRAVRRLHVQDAVGRALIESQTLKEATPRIFHALCDVGGWDVAALWQVDRAANELFCAEVWHVPSVRVPEFEAITRERRFAPGVGLPGCAWATGKPTWLPNITVDNNFPRAPIALKEGLRAGFCFPMKVGEEVIGVIECFSRRQREPDESFLQMLAAIGDQLGQFIDRKRAEEALRAKEAQLRLITDITPVMLAQCSPEGRYTFVNHAYAQRFGMTPEEIAGRKFAEVMGEKAVEAIQPYIDIVLQGRAVEYEIEIPYSRLGPRFMRVAYTPDRDEQGHVRGWVASISDITERKRTEAALEEARAQLKTHADDLELIVAERTQELRETIAEVESFSYSISHDMRGPLRAMQGYASVLEHELKGKIGDEEWRYLGRIVAAAARLNRLVQDILSYSQISRTKLQLAPVDLHALMIEVIQQNPNLQSPLADVRIEGPLPIVFGHEAALTQICSNLLSNAAKFVYPGTTPHIRISSELNNGIARICIADHGIGIDPKNHERIFQMFEQVNNPKDYDGTGIGLAIVKKAVERMGGRVGIASELGKGSQFWFDLRCASSD